MSISPVSFGVDCKVLRIFFFLPCFLQFYHSYKPLYYLVEAKKDTRIWEEMCSVSRFGDQLSSDFGSGIYLTVNMKCRKYMATRCFRSLAPWKCANPHLFPLLFPYDLCNLMDLCFFVLFCSWGLWKWIAGGQGGCWARSRHHHRSLSDGRTVAILGMGGIESS